MRTALLLFCFAILSLTVPARGQEVDENGKELRLDSAAAPIPLRFEEEQLNSYLEDPEFDYHRELQQDNWWTRLKRYVGLQYQRLMNWIFGDYQASSLLLFFIKVLPYLVLAGVLYLAVWVFSRMNPAAAMLATPEQGGVFLSEEEEIIKSRDIAELIRNAIAEKNYRLAIRYYFLLILQQLTQKELIVFEDSKTDEDYLKEIQQENLQRQFKSLTRIYDFIWYGNFEASEAQFLRSQREFEKMQDLIRKAS